MYVRGGTMWMFGIGFDKLDFYSKPISELGAG